MGVLRELTEAQQRRLDGIGRSIHLSSKRVRRFLPAFLSFFDPGYPISAVGITSRTSMQSTACGAP